MVLHTSIFPKTYYNIAKQSHTQMYMHNPDIINSKPQSIHRKRKFCKGQYPVINKRLTLCFVEVLIFALGSSKLKSSIVL